ncbi:Hypothetical predicted protein [Mytilus galloprovincialis]|uniref:Uncharacterized protein n=1 Tax=Mytilus galloprovincialis TaxID=29158 RepID=A0A8B6GWX3_MYTGA|nr:Hypothetical predicted protein [Mytilus galloprovincialis]
MERSVRCSEESQVCIITRTKWHPYKVYKKCPKIFKHLWRLLKVVWRKGKRPSCWQKAEGCFIPKEEKLEDITQFRTISLLNVEGKIFFSFMARRMTSYMTNINYVDTSVQKGGIPGFVGCIEHTSIISQLIQEAKVNKKDLTIIWPMPMISRSLMLYEITLTTVEKLERSINRHLRKWLGVPPSFTTVGLYSWTAKLQLPLTSLVEEFKVSKSRLVDDTERI